MSEALSLMVEFGVPSCMQHTNICVYRKSNVVFREEIEEQTVHINVWFLMIW